MANNQLERPLSPDESTNFIPDIERQFTSSLGPAAGSEVYRQMSALVKLIDTFPQPILEPSLEKYIETNGINPKVVVVDSRRSFIIAYSNKHAELLRREVAYRRLVKLGESILRAPQ